MIEEAKVIFGETVKFNNWTIETEDFLQIFQGAFPNPTYTKLMEIDKGKKGYQDYFDYLLEKGKLPQ